jgi:hypothetical protein
MLRNLTASKNQPQMQSVKGQKHNGKFRKLVKQKYIPKKTQLWFILVFLTKKFKENIHYYILETFYKCNN